MLDLNVRRVSREDLVGTEGGEWFNMTGYAEFVV
jgi:hypothetical protein